MQLVKAQTGAITPATEVSPWRQAANEEQGASFGTLLKFVKGDWLLGEEQTEVTPTTMFIANMHEYWRGWIKWQNREPIAHLIGRVVDRFHVPPREELGDLDEAHWETDSAGAKRDPWQRVVYLVLRNTSNDEIVTFTSTSDGGRKAVAKLADRFDRQRHKHPAQMPTVALKQESYQHPEYGKVLKLKFEVVGWDFWDEDAKNDPAGTLRQQQADEMDDQIPF